MRGLQEVHGEAANVPQQVKLKLRNWQHHLSFLCVASHPLLSQVYQQEAGQLRLNLHPICNICNMQCYTRQLNSL